MVSWSIKNHSIGLSLFTIETSIMEKKFRGPVVMYIIWDSLLISVCCVVWVSEWGIFDVLASWPFITVSRLDEVPLPGLSILLTPAQSMRDHLPPTTSNRKHQYRHHRNIEMTSNINKGDQWKDRNLNLSPSRIIRLA